MINLESEQVLSRIKDYLASMAIGEADELCQFLHANAEVVFLPSGQILFHEGDSADCMYIAIRGRLRASVVGAAGKIMPVMEIGRNDAFGEIALFTDEPRNATITAIRDSLLLAIRRDQFAELSSISPAYSLELSRRVIRRLSKSMRGQTGGSSKSQRLVVVPAGEDISVDDFTLGFSQSLQAHGSLVEVDESAYQQYVPSHIVDDILEPEEYSVFADWLEEQESQYPFIVLKTDRADSEWALGCIGLADKVILVGSEADLSAPPEKFVEALNSASATLDRVVLRGKSIQRSIVNERIAVPYSAIHNIRLHNQSDMDRLARFYANKAIGLVLAGGGAKGFAHIGALKAFREFGIPVDSVGGTSIGAVIAAYIAMGLSVDEMQEISREGFIIRKPLGDYTVPTIALLRGSRLNEVLKAYTRVSNIEDLWVSFYAVSANLTSNQTVVHDKGSLLDALRASISLPGIVPPVVRDDELLVDGGLVNNLPVDVMAASSVSKIIAIDLQGEGREFKVDPSLVSAANTLVRPMLGRKKQSKLAMPNLFEIMMKSSLISSAQQTNKNRDLADLFLNPPTENVRLLDFKSMDEVIEIGYRYTCQRLEALDNSFLD